MSIVGFFYSSKTDSWWGGAFAETKPVVAMNTPLSHCHAWLGATQYSVQFPKHTHTHTELDGGRQADREGGREERGRMEDGREGAMGGWGREGEMGGSEESMM